MILVGCGGMWLIVMNVDAFPIVVERLCSTV